MRILLVEDDPLLGDALVGGLKQEGYAVDWATRTREATQHVAAAHHDLVVLDLGLPDGSGIDWLKAFRAGGGACPVLIVTARDTVTDRIRGLDTGADDYLVKPFDLEELHARVRAQLRRASGKAVTQLLHGGLKLDLAAHQATLNDVPIECSAKEFMLLRLLVENVGKVLTRARLEQLLYGDTQDIASNAVEVHVHHLRKKLGNDFIRTVRGVGYTVPVTGA
jgi:two-component system response regulator QseB